MKACLTCCVLCVLVLILAACAAPTATPAPPTAAPPPVPTVEPGTYYFLAANVGDPYYVPGLACLDKAAKQLNVKTAFVGPTDLSLSSQMKTLEELVANPDTKGILIYVLDPNAAEPQFKAAKAKGIPIVVGDSDTPSKTRNAYVGTNNAIFGGQAADWAADLTACKGPVGTIALNNASTTTRINAFEARIKDRCPGIQVIPWVTHDGSAANASAVLDSYVSAHPDANLIWWADGVVGQMAQNWKDKQAAGVNAMLLASDMPPATLQAVKDGIFVGTLGQDTCTEEGFGLKVLYAAAHGERVPDTLSVGAIVIDKSNVDQFLK